MTFKVFLIFFIFLLLPSISFSAGYLPTDKGEKSIQGSAPDVEAVTTIGATGSATIDVSKDLAIRFKCNQNITYHLGGGAASAWEVDAGSEEFILIPRGKETLTLLSSVNPTVCKSQAGRR